jgi:ribosomal protein S18 acetylase RimI-like enzyme
MTTSHDLTIRLAQPGDVEEIHRALLTLARHVGDVNKVKSTPDDLRRYGFGPDPAFECLIAEIAGETAGICLFFRSFSTWFGRPGIYVQDLVVHEKFRGKRIGEHLLRRAAAIARERGFTYLRLAVDHENPTAMAFYERLGLVYRFDDLIYAAYGDAFEALAIEQRETT